MAPVGGDGPATRAAAVSCSYRRCRVDEGSPTAIRGTKLSKQLAVLRREKQQWRRARGAFRFRGDGIGTLRALASTTPRLGCVELNEFWVNLATQSEKRNLHLYYFVFSSCINLTLPH